MYVTDIFYLTAPCGRKKTNIQINAIVPANVRNNASQYENKSGPTIFVLTTDPSLPTIITKLTPITFMFVG